MGGIKRIRDKVDYVQHQGFALIATLSVMVLLVMVTLAMLSLSTIELRSSGNSRYQQEAKANARMALMIAIGELQKHAGPDQRVTARAAILESPAGGEILANRNWVGVWKTTYASGGREWPLIGKGSAGLADHAGVGGEPYPHEGIYSDLRETEPSLKNKAWRTKLHQGWLVSSKSQTVDPSISLSHSDSNVLEILGKGTLGSTGNYLENRVWVEKVNVGGGGGGGVSGAYAWYVSDNNQKASVSLHPDATGDMKVPFLASQIDNPTSVTSTSGGEPYTNYLDDAKGDFDKVVSYRTAAMIGASAAKRKELAAAFGAHFQHFTTDGAGLFVDTALGSLKKDLTPVMFGDPSSEIISLKSPGDRVAEHNFSSDTPIIPGPGHAVLGPSLGALRYWGRLKARSGLASGSIDADVEYQSSLATRMRPTTHWPHGISDGLTYDGAKWASSAPKIYPVMTDSRWHFYFSHTDDTSKQSIQTHIMPRVCLWNPYNVEMKTQAMIVLMPNPYWKGTAAFHFYFEKDEADRMKAEFPDEADIQKWGYKERWKIRLRGSAEDGQAGLFPDSRFLGFLLEASTYAPGECLVFSPLIHSADETSQGVGIQKYDKNNIATNILSATAPQAEDHFIHDYQVDWQELQYEKAPPPSPDNPNPTPKPGWEDFDQLLLKAMRLSEVFEYEPWAIVNDNFPFVLKAANGNANVSNAAITTSQATDYPTLQLINNGGGGSISYDFWWFAQFFGSSEGDPKTMFGFLENFAENPRKSPPALHQIGTKLLWLDETFAEGDLPPLRNGQWNSNHIAYNPSPIAQWNIRPSLSTRSPATACTQQWYTTNSGAWMQQFSPHAPNANEDQPDLNRDNQYYTKLPFGASSQFSGVKNAVMFDLPDAKYGALSLGAVRHAQLSPYSWHPTYIVGHSLVDLHAPFDQSAHENLAGDYSGNYPSSWDEAIGGFVMPWAPSRYGPRLAYQSNPKKPTSTGLLQIGDQATSRTIDGSMLSSKDEILAYDIAFEVNQNLWDRFFISGIPLSSDGASFNWKPSKGELLWNERYQFNRASKVNLKEIENQWNHASGGEALSFGFWHNAYLIKNKGAFNVNSTSVEAWIAFLSGLQGLERVTQNGMAGGGTNAVFSRIQKPSGSVKTEDSGTEVEGGWFGGRSLTEGEIALLAREMVREVKTRGPFVSMADFVNRRLAPKSNPSSMMGALDAAILRTNLNRHFEKAEHLTTKENSNDNNHKDWKMDLDKQPKSKSWGLPGFLTQGDLLEPLASAMTVRGDSFVIRAYGESRDTNGKVMAQAYLEAVVERAPDYVDAANMNDIVPSKSANLALEPAMRINRITGAVTVGDLSEVNKRYGRKLIIKSFRWLSPNEI